MSRTAGSTADLSRTRLPVELIELHERIQAQPDRIRAELEPLIEDAMEDARFRGQAMSLARDALRKYQMDLAMLQFDLEATRRERRESRWPGP